MFVSIADIGGIVAIDADAFGHQPAHFLHGQPPGILGMIAIDDIGQRLRAAAVGELQRHRFFQIDRSHQFALAQIGDGVVAVAAGDAEGDALTGAAMVKPKDKAGTLRRAAMDMGEDAQRAVIAMHPGQRAVDEVEARPPHQRAIAKHPEIVVAFRLHDFS